MSWLKTTFAGFLAAAAMSAATVGPVTSKFNVPFEFEAAGKTMPAGAYEMRLDGNTAILMSPKSKEGVFLTPAISSFEGKGSRIRLTFQEVGGQHFLRSIYEGPATGRLVELPVSKREKAVRAAAAQKQTSEVEAGR